MYARRKKYTMRGGQMVASGQHTGGQKTYDARGRVSNVARASISSLSNGGGATIYHRNGRFRTRGQREARKAERTYRRATRNSTPHHQRNRGSSLDSHEFNSTARLRADNARYRTERSHARSPSRGRNNRNRRPNPIRNRNNRNSAPARKSYSDQAREFASLNFNDRRKLGY